MSRPTASITPNVMTYWASLTAKLSCGGTKKKSNTSTLATAAATAGPRPYRVATNATPSRNTITTFASASRNDWLTQPSSVHTVTTAAVARYGRQSNGAGGVAGARGGVPASA